MIGHGPLNEVLDDNIVDKIKSNLSLEMEYPPDSTKELTVRKKHNELHGVHPIHGTLEENRNYIVHRDSQTWYCFRDKSSGDIIDMIAIDEGIIDCEDAGNLSGTDFIEALEVAANRANIDLDNQNYDKEEIKKKKDEWAKLQDCFNIAVERWKENLKNNQEVIDWIKEKYGFDEETIDEMDIGYADPQRSSLFDEMRQKTDEIDCYKTGLFFRISEKWVDFFQGRVVFPYRFYDDYVYFIARKTPWTDESEDWQMGKYLKQLTPERYDYVSDQIQNHLWGLDSLRGHDEVIVTEGITDAIALRDWDYPVISPVTTRFRRDDIEKVKKAVKDKRVYVCNDNDEGGLKGALDTLEHIDDSMMIEFSRELPEGYDLNDFYKDKTKEDFEELKKDALCREDALAKHRDDMIYLFKAALKDNSIDPERVRKVWDTEAHMHDFSSIEDILDGCYDIKEGISVFRRTEKTFWRTPTAVESSLRKSIIAGVIERDMRKGGEFLKDPNKKRCYFFSKEDNTVFDLASDESKWYLKNNYGVNMTTEEGKYLEEDLINYARNHGTEVKVERYFHFDKEKNELYIHNRNHHYYKLDGDSIQYCLNGEDVFFETLHQEKIVYKEKDEREYPDKVMGEIDEWENKGHFLHQILVNRTNLASKTALTAEQQRLQLMITLYMFPFDSAFQAKPIIAFIGEKGSGKSMTMKMLGKFLTSPDYDVSTMPDEQDFYNTAHNNPIYFLDNVDKGSKWLNDALAAIATGAKMKQRKLYTNYEEVEARLNTFLGLNSRDPHFKRDDVVDRLLIFYVDRLEQNIKPDLLTGPIERYWNTLWSEYMDDLNSIVKSMKDNDGDNITTEHRLVDWVHHAYMVQEGLDMDKKNIDELVENMMLEKISFSLEGDRLLPALRTLQKVEEDQIGSEVLDEWLSARELYEKLCEVDELFADAYNSAQSLAKRLPNVRMELDQLVGLKKKHNKTKHRNEYMLNSTERNLEELHDEDDKSLDDFDEGGGMDLEKEIEKAQEGKLLEDEEELKKYLGEKNGRE